MVYFLLLWLFFVFYEAIGQLLESSEINTNRLLIVSIANFAVNMIGIFFDSVMLMHNMLMMVVVVVVR
jgi:Co/Zn/Cd efflux system component